MHHEAEGGSWSLSSTQNDQLPAAVGTPLMSPSWLSESPGGNVPERNLNW
jgi:hypothetical protein